MWLVLCYITGAARWVSRYLTMAVQRNTQYIYEPFSVIEKKISELHHIDIADAQSCHT